MNNKQSEVLAQIIHARNCAQKLREYKQTERHEMSAISLEWLAAEVERLHNANQKLTAFVSYYATCPCCNQDQKCLDGCTFEEDAPNAYDVMQEARESMK